jgi:predicted lipoprotein
MRIFRLASVALCAGLAAAHGVPPTPATTIAPPVATTATARELLSFVDGYVIPSFNKVAQNTEQQAKAWDDYCARPRNPVALRNAYIHVSDAWAAVEFIRTGPASANLRLDRFNFWLDREGAIDRAMASLLKAPDAGGLAPDKLAAGSAAVQGMPVIERLLYPDAPLKKLAAKSPEAVRRCALGRAVAHNLAKIASEIVADWISDSGARAAIAMNTAWDSAFLDANEAIGVYLTDIVSGSEMLKDSKISTVFHDALSAKGPRLAEARNSRRSVHIARLNLEGVRKSLAYFLGQQFSEQKLTLELAFQHTDAVLRALEAAMRTTDRKAKLAAAQEALTQTGALTKLLQTTVPENTGVALGLNGLDGD